MGALEPAGQAGGNMEAWRWGGSCNGIIIVKGRGEGGREVERASEFVSSGSVGMSG